MNSVELYVVKDPSNLAMSFAWDPDNLVKVGADGYSKKLDGDKIVLNIKNKVDPTNPNKSDVIRGDSVLVARYEGKFKNDAFDDAATRVTFDNGTPAGADNYHWDNIIYTTDANASGTGDEEVGYFKDYHVYQTINADGRVKTDYIDYVAQQQGPESEKYETVKKDREGYELVSVESPDGAAFDEHGDKTTGNFVNGKTLHVKYVYEKRPVEKKGSFQEHHIYQTKKLDGTIVKDDEVNKDVTEGTEKENYKTSKEDRDGYKLIEVKSVNGGKFNKDGSEKEAAYIADTKQEVTYIYQKEEAKPWTPIEETGKFQEHHIYITKDKDGNEIKREVVDEDVSGGTEDMTYTTGKDEKDGFKFVRTESPVEDPSYSEQGEETEGNYKPGVTQEITYVYEKTESEWTPIEPSEPVDPEKPGEGDSSIPWTPLEPSEPVDPETPDIPWTPLEPSEPVEPETPGETPETPETPEKPEKSENPEKPEKTGKENPTSPEVDKDKKDNRVKVPVVKSKKEVKKETPVRKNGNPKTGVGSISGAALGLIAAASGLFVSKKNKDEE